MLVLLMLALLTCAQLYVTWFHGLVPRLWFQGLVAGLWFWLHGLGLVPGLWFQGLVPGQRVGRGTEDGDGLIEKPAGGGDTREDDAEDCARD